MWSQNLCRICGQTSDMYHLIFSSDANNDIEEKIKKCLNLTICKDDYKPKQICVECFEKITEFSRFIDICNNANLKFESHACNCSVDHSYSLPKHSVIVENTQIVDKNSTTSYCENSTETTTVPLPQHYEFNERDIILEFVDYTSKSSSETVHQTVVKHSTEITKSTVSNHVINYEHQQEIIRDDAPTSTASSEANVETEKAVTSPSLISVQSVRSSLVLPQLKPPSKPPTKPGKKYSCPYCNRQFLRRSSLNSHSAIHTKLKPFGCAECSKAFAIKSDLTTHKKIHTDHNKCKYCGKKFTVPSKLNRHVRIHTNERPYVCFFANCGKSFTDKRNLCGHMAIHNPVREHCCALCVKKFKTKARLRQHEKSHSCTILYKCDLCAKQYKYKRNLINHIKKHDYCPYCKKNCSGRVSLFDHVKVCKMR